MPKRRDKRPGTAGELIAPLLPMTLKGIPADQWLAGSFSKDRPPPVEILPFWEWESQRRDFILIGTAYRPWPQYGFYYGFWETLRKWKDLKGLMRRLSLREAHAVIFLLEQMYCEVHRPDDPVPEKLKLRKDSRGYRYRPSVNVIIQGPDKQVVIPIPSPPRNTTRGRPLGDKWTNQSLHWLAQVFHSPTGGGTDWASLARTVRHFTGRKIIRRLNTRKLDGLSRSYMEDALRKRVAKFRSGVKRAQFTQYSKKLYDQVCYLLKGSVLI